MWKDPIVEETRKLREEFASQFNHDADAIFEEILKRQRRGKNKLVSFIPRTEPVKPHAA